ETRKITPFGYELKRPRAENRENRRLSRLQLLEWMEGIANEDIMEVGRVGEAAKWRFSEAPGRLYLANELLWRMERTDRTVPALEEISDEERARRRAELDLCCQKKANFVFAGSHTCGPPSSIFFRSIILSQRNPAMA